MNDRPVEIVEINEANAGLLDRMGDDVFDEPIDPGRLERYLREPGHIMLLAVMDDEVVGMCTAMVHRHADKPTELYVDEIGVAERLRRLGIGRQLLRRMFETGRQRGCTEAWLGTELDNVAARALYDAAGPAESYSFAYYLFDLGEG